ncbi:MAG: GAF domain-containing protein [Acidimicrobiales bacterium]
MERLVEISNYDLFSTEVRTTLDDFARRAAERFGLPTAMISIVLDTAQYWAGMHGVDGWKAEAQGTPVEWAFCANVVRTGHSYVVENAEIDELQRDNPLVTEDGQRCYAGAPLITPSGHVLGACCVVGNEPRTFTPAEIDELAAMADEVVAELEQHRMISKTAASQ